MIMIGQQLSADMEETLGDKYFTCTSTGRRSFGTARWCLLLHDLSEWLVTLRGQDRWGSMPMTCKHKMLQPPQDYVGESASARMGVVPMLIGPHSPLGAKVFVCSL